MFFTSYTLQFRHVVELVRPIASFNEQIRWEMTVRHLADDRQTVDYFDAVVVCNG